MIPLNPLAAPIPLARHAEKPGPPAPLTPQQAELRKAAEGFEAIMVRKMLSAARAAFAAEATPLTGGGMQQFTAMRDERLADIAASTGAFGFARSIEAQLAQHLGPQGDQ
jgi:flagellar protein FlgJ